MKKVFISLACLSVLFVFMGSAFAYTYVVYKQANGPCQTGNYYYNDGQSYKCIDYSKPPKRGDVYKEFDCGPIQYAYDDTFNDPTSPDTVVVCPGDYDENLYLRGSKITLSGPDTRDPNDPMNPAKNAIIHASDPKKHTIFVSRGKYKAIRNLTITGATSTAPCLTGYITYCDPAFTDYDADACYTSCYNSSSLYHPCKLKEWNDQGEGPHDHVNNICNPNSSYYYRSKCVLAMNENPPQPCAGIRAYGVNGDYSKSDPPPLPDLLTDMCPFTYNSVTGNNIGIIIKDTSYQWFFDCRIENNDIYGNEVAGVHLRYGRESSILNNYIYDNPVGIWLADTWDNEIMFNIIQDNSLYGIKLENTYYTMSNNLIKNNNIINNTSQALSPSGNYWSYNYWSTYAGLDTNNNGIGDTNRPHYYDSYPFMYSYGWECYGILSKYPVKNSNLSAYYYKLQTAYNAAGNGNIIQARDIIFPESSGLVINRPVSVTLRLGFDDNNCAYLTNSGTTILKGNMTVSSGALTINSGVLGIE